MTSEDFRAKIIGDLLEFVGKDADKNLIEWFEERTITRAAISTTTKNFSKI
jgi:hypothetical protein